MSPQSPRNPTPAGSRGRHHRPESLADVFVPASSDSSAARSSATPSSAAPLGMATDLMDRPEPRYRRGKPVVSFVGDDVSFVDDDGPASVPRQRDATRHQRPTRGGRHAAATPTRPPTTGAHRAPGTLPIESWLLMG